MAIAAPSAQAETRTLKLYFIHTNERAEITFKRNGRYDREGLKKINRFLRDWRKNEPTQMDPQLLDIVWEAYQMSGARDYIHVVSGYRSPATNDMLRRTRGGQAKKSQHMLGKAMDFFIPGVKLSKLREIGFKLQGGGVGYYPNSGSPFVHFDTGSVRAWPRMSRSQLVSIFPNGGTLHLPPDGKPLPGYDQAMAAYKSRKAKGQATAITTRGSSGGGGGGGGTLLAALFGGGADEEEDIAESAAPAPRPAPVAKAAPEPRKAEPDSGRPNTLMAALAASKLPVPTLAPPRPAEAVPTRTEQPAEAPPAPVVAAAPEPAPVAPVLDAKSIPLPAHKPQVLLARTEETAPQPGPTLAAASQPQTETTQFAEASVPLPIRAPRVDASSEPLTQMASLPEPKVKPEEESAVPMAVAYAPPERGATDPVTSFPAAALKPAERSEGSSRSARIASPETAVASYDTGVTTTSKSGRVKSGQTAKREIAAAVVPAGQIDPARFGSWTTAAVSITDEGRPADRPKFLQNALREAPTQVYTAGFKKERAPDSRRFSGKAVTFLAVAKFEDGGKGGDGQPLTLQLPITN